MKSLDQDWMAFWKICFSQTQVIGSGGLAPWGPGQLWGGVREKSPARQQKPGAPATRPAGWEKPQAPIPCPGSSSGWVGESPPTPTALAEAVGWGKLPLPSSGPSPTQSPSEAVGWGKPLPTHRPHPHQKPQDRESPNQRQPCPQQKPWEASPPPSRRGDTGEAPSPAPSSLSRTLLLAEARGGCGGGGKGGEAPVP